MDIFSKAVHAGDRKKPGIHIPSTTPIYLASSYSYESIETIDKIFGHEEHGPSYARYENPTNNALEEQITALENGAGALACASGMCALQTALIVSMLDRRKTILAASDLYGATINMLLKLFDPMGYEIRFVNITDISAVEKAIAEVKPGCVLMETVSNPVLRVGEIDKIAALARAAGAALIVDNTFSTPLLVRPLELGAHFSVHSATKYLAGHGDVLGGLIIADSEHLEPLRAYSRIVGPVMAPVEAYLTMRGIKTFPLRMERQCLNANAVAAALAAHPRVDRVFFTGDPAHPDAAVIARLFPANQTGAIVSFEIKGATTKQDVFRFMDALQMVVRGTSLGDVHSLVLYPLIASHRDLPPKQRERMGIKDNLVRISVGIESAADIIADLDRALGAV
jgi:cystathionine beta-lyase/cystathionine gamma-synthase